MIVDFNEEGTTDPLFSSEMDAPPRVGERVEFAFRPRDRNQWDDDTAAYFEVLHGKSFVVTSVEHFLLIRSLQSRSHQATCTVRMLTTPPAAEPGAERSE